MDEAKLDAYESIFKSAAKTRFRHSPVQIESALVVTDTTTAEASPLLEQARSFLAPLDDGAPEVWHVLGSEHFSTVQELLALIEKQRPDLIVTHRNLFEEEHRPRHSLGVYVDELTQVSRRPLLLLPHPRGPGFRAMSPDTSQVMALTDYMSNNDLLVNIAVHFTRPGGTCFLTHVEPGRIFERYMQVIEKIPSIQTEPAREAILEKLLEGPSDFIHSCMETLRESGVSTRLEPIVQLGQRVTHHRELVTEHQVDLLVVECRDESHMAMNPMAYLLAVELPEVPQLLA